VLVGCATAPSGPVATVDGSDIPRELLEGWIREATDANQDLDAVGLQADLLARVIQQRIIDAVLVERGLSVDPSLATAIREDITAQVGGELSLAATLVDIGFPEDYFEEVFLALEAAVDTLVLSLADGLTLETRTARHILVETRGEADEVVALLAEGADFATLAQERSQDPGSGPQGGDLGPQRRGTFVPPFDDAVWSAPLDTVLEPVESEFGFHVIEVTAVVETPAAELGAQERRGLVATELEAIVGGAIAAAEVTVDPTIGTWNAATGGIAPATE
jgi:parvulin-like peptidyl-prolyl isomerase